MKNINQFDFPSKQTQSYKNNHYDEHSDSKEKTLSSKLRYKQNLHYHMEKQRNLAKENQKNKKIQDSQRKKKELQSELQKKKKQLQNLQVLKQRAQENQKKSFQLALKKQEQDRVKKEQNLLRKQRFDQNAVNRFQDALRKMHEQKQMTAFKQKLAQQRRKTAQEFEKIERAKANQYKSEVEEKEKREKQEQGEKVQFYQKTIRTFSSNPNPDYNRSCLHNLKIVPEKKDSQRNAFELGNAECTNVREKSEERLKKNYEFNERSKERGRQALLKIQRQKELEQYQKQSMEQQKQYNMERIQAGLKPTTLTQIQQYKQQRSEQQFDKMFFVNQLNDNGSKPVTKYEIVENNIPSHNINKSQTNSQTKKITKNKVKQESQYPNISQGKHSFEEPEYSEFKSDSQINSRLRKDEHQNLYENQNEEEVQNRDFQEQNYLKNSLKETRIPDQRQRTNKMENKMVSKGLKQVEVNKKQKYQNQRPSNTKNQQYTAFNADKLLEKYGLKNEATEDKGERGGKGQGKDESKRKVVQLGNICQNRRGQKEELSYSSESEEDSLS